MNLVVTLRRVSPSNKVREENIETCLYTWSVTRRRGKLMYLLLALQLPTERLFLLQTCALAKWRERLLSLNTAATCCYRLSAGGGLGYTMDVLP